MTAAIRRGQAAYRTATMTLPSCSCHRHRSLCGWRRAALAIRRDLATSRPDAFLIFLATVPNNQSSCLGHLDRPEDALDAATQAVTMQRYLAAI